MTKPTVPGQTMTVAELRKHQQRSMSEADWQSEVIDLAHRHNWLVAAFRKVRVQRKNGSVYYETPVQADGKGWLDLYMTRGYRAVVAELKVARNKPTPGQEIWMEAHRKAGVEVYVWRPSDIDEIERVLA